MSINSILNIATSGLFAGQSGIKAVTQNITNVNTKGYVRVEQEQSTLSLAGKNGGVQVDALRRAANSFLQTASLGATSASQNMGTKAQYLDEVQSAFGDPTGAGSLFSRINSTLGSFETALANPGSLAVRRDIIAQMQGVLGQIGSVASTLQGTKSRVDTDIATTISEINTILKDISDINGEVARNLVTADATGAQERQSQLIDKLSNLIDIHVDYTPNGIANITTSDGTFLAGAEHSTLNYKAAPSGQPYYGNISISFAGDTTGRAIEQSINGGKLRGLLDLRNGDLEQITQSLGEFAGKFADAINAVHNTTATLPAIARAQGIDTGLLTGDSLGFTGKTTIGIVATNGTLARKIAIDFDLGTLSVDGGAAIPIGTSIGSFAAALNGALGTFGSASFSNGALTLNNATAGNGFVFDEPATNKSMRGDKSFAHFFGLNNLISSSQPTSYTTGLKGTDAHGFTVGDSFTLRLNAPNGSTLAARAITIPAGTVNDILNAMNNASTGLGLYGNFALGSDGALQWNANGNNQNYQLELTSDTAPRGTTQKSFGQLMGLNQLARSSRATTLAVNPSIVADPRKLGLALPDLTSVALGAVAVGVGDSMGAQAFFNASNTRMNFISGLGQASNNMTLSEYFSTLAGDVGSRAATAESDKAAADALKTEAEARRSNVEGVNLDEDLIKLTSYQQAYSASARMIRAADEMYQALLNAI